MLLTVPVMYVLCKDWGKRALSLSRAREGRVPTGSFQPQLATLGQTPPKGEQWLHEIKWDGYRIPGSIAEGNVSLWSRDLCMQ